VVDAMVGVAVVGRGVVADEALRSQGLGGDDCMWGDMGEAKTRWMPLKLIQSHMICYIRVSTYKCLR
jgi:hypothetical protein